MANDPTHLQNYLNRYLNQTLIPLGWLESCKEELPVDIHKNPLPWWTYPAIELISTIVKPEFEVFEYGGGYSTLWWSKFVSRVVTVDHDQAWVNKIAPHLHAPHEIIWASPSQNCSIQAQELADSYFNANPNNKFPYDDEKINRRGLNDRDFIWYADNINQYEGDFDIIVIDGMARRLCAHFAIPKLKDNGLIVFDNSNRSDYLEGYKHLIESGLRPIPLWGNVPSATFPSCTSLFVKNIECLSTSGFHPSIFRIPEY